MSLLTGTTLESWRLCWKWGDVLISEKSHFNQIPEQVQSLTWTVRAALGWYRDCCLSAEGEKMWNTELLQQPAIPVLGMRTRADRKIFLVFDVKEINGVFRLEVCSVFPFCNYPVATKLLASRENGSAKLGSLPLSTWLERLDSQSWSVGRSFHRGWS